MNPFAIWPRDSGMNAPEKHRRELGKVEIVREGDTLIMRRVVDTVKFRKIADKVLANRPRPKKGASIVRELNESRHRGGR
jgi:hypothetical protein